MSYFCPEKFWFSSENIQLPSNSILKQLNDNLDPEKKKQGWTYVFIPPKENRNFEGLRSNPNNRGRYFEDCFKLVRFTLKEK